MSILSLYLPLIVYKCVFVLSFAHKHLPLHFPLATEVLKSYFQSFGLGFELRRLLEHHF